MVAIFKREVQSYFTSFIGYMFLFIFVAMSALYFYLSNIMPANPDYSSTLQGSLIFFLILIPILTMRLFSEEMRSKTDQLIFTAPVSITDIVLAKFLSAFVIFLVGMLLTMVFPAIIYFSGALPVEKTIGVIAGYLLLVSCFISVGIFVSALTENQIIAAVSTFALLFFIFIIESFAHALPTDRTSSILFVVIVTLALSYILYTSTKNIVASILFELICLAIMGVLYFMNNLFFDGLIGNALRGLSLLSRFENFSQGIFDLSDIVFYLSFSTCFLYLTINTIEKRRWK